ncbi:hypothetical protein LCGC14_1560900, partial [marine sediment metagenome]
MNLNPEEQKAAKVLCERYKGYLSLEQIA